MLSALLAGCADSPRPGQSGQDGPPAITLNFDGEAVPFEPTYATFSTYRKNLVLTDAAIANPQERVPATVHRILLANYDLQAARAGLEDFRRIRSPGQFRVDIQIEAGMDTPADAPIRPGEYRPASTPFNRVGTVLIARYRNGRDSVTLLGGREASGLVRILPAAAMEVSAEIDIADADGSVRGTFTAHRLQETP